MFRVALASNRQFGIHQRATGGLKVNVIEAWATLSQSEHRQSGLIQLLSQPAEHLIVFHHKIEGITLGAIDDNLTNPFHWLQQTFPQKVCYFRGYNEPLAHQIEAGADIFLMPSRFEPCGLNQMYSLRYGTPPVVRTTGGLADTVEQFDKKTGKGTGFVFDHFDATGFAWALKRALETYRDREAWATVRRNGMEQDYSWDRQGKVYEELYRRLLA